MLGFGYAMLLADTTAAVVGVGLEPALGFYHQPRSSAPPLALDLMELFRVPMVDMPIVASINRGQWDPDADFTVAGERVWNGVTPAGESGSRHTNCDERCKRNGDIRWSGTTVVRANDRTRGALARKGMVRSARTVRAVPTPVAADGGAATLVPDCLRHPRSGALAQAAYRLLRGFGERIQYSIFRCRLSARQLEQLRWELEKRLDPVDSLLVVGLCEGCVERIRVKNRPETWSAVERPCAASSEDVGCPVGAGGGESSTCRRAGISSRADDAKPRISALHGEFFDN